MNKIKNNIFRFKKFEIAQDSFVMKVGTDGVLLGALTNCINVDSILDIGTGTGLIALMLAQKSNAKIDCIDINENAINLANYNISISQWNSRIKTYHTSLQNFKPEYKYDLIVSNPPYFSTDILAPDKYRALARHTTELTLQELVTNSIRLLNENGCINIIYPCQQAKELENIALNSGLFVKSRVFILPRKDSLPVRTITELTKDKCFDIYISEIIIENESRHSYTEQYINLTKDYYIKF